MGIFQNFQLKSLFPTFRPIYSYIVPMYMDMVYGYKTFQHTELRSNDISQIKIKLKNLGSESYQ